MEDRVGKEKSIYFTPAEAGVNWSKYVTEGVGQGMKWGTPRMNDRILPLGDAKMGSITALPGAGKTSLAIALAREYAKELRNQGVKNKAVLYISVDQTLEDITGIFLADRNHSVTDFAEGKVSHQEVIRLAREFVSMPVYVFAKSAVERRREQPRLTYANIEKGIYEMEKHVQCAPSLVVIDYIQNMPIEGNRERVEQVSEAVIKARELCLTVPCPMLVCVQAARVTKDREIKIPTPQDSQWSSALEQEMDVMLGIWKPSLTEIGKSTVEYADYEVPITDDLLFAGLVKQRRKPAGFVFALHFNGGTLELADMDLSRLPKINNKRRMS